MKENAVEDHLVLRVRQLGGKCYKWAPEGVRHVMDRLCFLPQGRLVLVETKRPGESLRPGQVRRRNELLRLGHEAVMLDTKEKIDDYFGF